jgi:hypothetical protein
MNIVWFLLASVALMVVSAVRWWKRDDSRWVDAVIYAVLWAIAALAVYLQEVAQ